MYNDMLLGFCCATLYIGIDFLLKWQEDMGILR